MNDLGWVVPLLPGAVILILLCVCIPFRIRMEAERQEAAERIVTAEDHEHEADRLRRRGDTASYQTEAAAAYAGAVAHEEAARRIRERKHAS